MNFDVILFANQSSNIRTFSIDMTFAQHSPSLTFSRFSVTQFVIRYVWLHGKSNENNNVLPPTGHCDLLHAQYTLQIRIKVFVIIRFSLAYCNILCCAFLYAVNRNRWRQTKHVNANINSTGSLQRLARLITFPVRVYKHIMFVKIRANGLLMVSLVFQVQDYLSLVRFPFLARQVILNIKIFVMVTLQWKTDEFYVNQPDICDRTYTVFNSYLILCL